MQQSIKSKVLVGLISDAPALGNPSELLDVFQCVAIAPLVHFPLCAL